MYLSDSNVGWLSRFVSHSTHAGIVLSIVIGKVKFACTRNSALINFKHGCVKLMYHYGYVIEMGKSNQCIITRICGRFSQQRHCNNEHKQLKNY